MKKIVIQYFMLNIVFQLYSTEFKTQIYFMDSKGNKDTVTVGYSKFASNDSLYSALGEFEIPDEKIDTNFFIGISNVRSEPTLYKYQKTSFRTKVKYADFKEPDYRRTLNIDVICKHFPLTISWNNNEFIDSIRSKSCITSIDPGGWFDVAGFIEFLGKTSSTILSESDLFHDDNNTFYIDSIHSKPVKVGSLYVGFLENKYSLGTNLLKENSIYLYPNPCENFITIKSGNEYLKQIQFFDLTGRMITFESLNKKEEIIDISNLKSGLYLLKILDNLDFKIFTINKQ